MTHANRVKLFQELVKGTLCGGLHLSGHMRWAFPASRGNGLSYLKMPLNTL